MENASSYLTPIITFAVIGFIFWFSNRKSDEATECRSGFIIIIVYCLGASMAGMGLFALVFYNDSSDGLNEEVWLLPVIAVIFIVFTAFAFDSFFRKASWDDHTLTVKRLCKSTKTIPWGNVTSLKYNYLFQYHYLVFADGTKFAFNEMFLGGQALIMAFEEFGQSET